jgi:hypothetical protein
MVHLPNLPFAAHIPYLARKGITRPGDAQQIKPHADHEIVRMTWIDVAQPLTGGLAGILGVLLVEDLLSRLRRARRCPPRWAKDR